MVHVTPGGFWLLLTWDELMGNVSWKNDENWWIFVEILFAGHLLIQG